MLLREIKSTLEIYQTILDFFLAVLSDIEKTASEMGKGFVHGMNIH